MCIGVNPLCVHMSGNKMSQITSFILFAFTCNINMSGSLTEESINNMRTVIDSAVSARLTRRDVVVAIVMSRKVAIITLRLNLRSGPSRGEGRGKFPWALRHLGGPAVDQKICFSNKVRLFDDSKTDRTHHRSTIINSCKLLTVSQLLTTLLQCPQAS